jgi:hypothetical protein
MAEMTSGRIGMLHKAPGTERVEPLQPGSVKRPPDRQRNVTAPSG